jgi:hypothetical protein
MVKCTRMFKWAICHRGKDLQDVVVRIRRLHRTAQAYHSARTKKHEGSLTNLSLLV